MYLPMRPHHIGPRLTTGAFILASGVRKLEADDKTEEGMHAMATGAYPFLGGLAPHRFTRLLAGAEIGVGTALVLPFVPGAIAGAALTGFAAGLVGLYLRTPGTHHKGIPTEDGIPLAKDTWMLGIGLGLLSDPESWKSPQKAARQRLRASRRRRWA